MEQPLFDTKTEGTHTFRVARKSELFPLIDDQVFFHPTYLVRTPYPDRRLDLVHLLRIPTGVVVTVSMERANSLVEGGVLVPTIGGTQNPFRDLGIPGERM